MFCYLLQVADLMAGLSTFQQARLLLSGGPLPADFVFHDRASSGELTPLFCSLDKVQPTGKMHPPSTCRPFMQEEAPEDAASGDTCAGVLVICLAELCAAENCPSTAFWVTLRGAARA
jgi:hypothetical protein